MTDNEVARCIIAFLIGVCNLMFGASMLVRSRKDVRTNGWWPLPWETIAGIYMAALGVVFWGASLRLTPATNPDFDNELALAISAVALVLAVLTVWRWFTSERETR